MSKRKVVSLHDDGALALPLSNGCKLRVTAFHETPRIALTIHGPGGGDRGGVILSPDRARLLASWLARLADGMTDERPAAS